MLRHSFLKQLSHLNNKVSEMGEKVSQVLKETINSLTTRDIDTAKKIVNNDCVIDKLEHSIERDCMNILALQQPMASDLRMVAGCLKIITDIERIADQCTDICELICMDKIPVNAAYLDKVLEMLKSVSNMLDEALVVFKNRNIDNAVSICKSDDAIDLLFSDIVHDICGVIKKGTFEVVPEVDLLFITKYAERIGDHCTNIAEWVIYMETGQHPDLN